MKNLFSLLIIVVLFWSCGGDKTNANVNSKPTANTTPADNGKGYGEIKTVKLNDPLDKDMAKRGLAIYEMKCSACHKLNAKRVVGPGWAGLTDKRKPEWIMNMITNVDVMLEKDPTAQKLLEECLTRMPNQNVSIGDARDILEFMYKNDLDQKAK
jgi:mono/diheme cytochrome c family protein